MDRAKRYNNIKLGLSLSRSFLGWIFLLLIVLTGATRVVEGWTHSITASSTLALLLFASIFGFLNLILFFPLTFYNGYVLEHRYELSNYTLKSFFWENIKALFVGLVIGVPLLVIFYFFLKTYGNDWWIPVGIFLFFFSVILGRLAPTLILPLFYKFVPVEDERVADLVRKRCESVGMKVEGIFQFDLSKTTKKANAAFTGIGRSKRIILGDNLIHNFTLEEIDAVLAHELGHFKKKHLWKMMAVGTVSTFIGLYLVSLAYSEWVVGLGFGSLTRLAGLPLLGLLMGIYSFVTGPVQNIISRYHERKADQFSREMLEGKSEFMISALRKLAEQNLADRDPNPVVEFLFHSHPSIKHRIEYLDPVTVK